MSDHVFNLFSNLWFYFGTGNITNDMENITKLKQIHGINKSINMDDKTGFWPDTISRYQNYDDSIVKQLQIHNSQKLLETYKYLSKMINTLIQNPTTIQKNGKTKDHIVLFYTMRADNAECLMALYIYYLCTMAHVNLITAIQILKSKIEVITPHKQQYLLQFTNDMTSFLHLNCNTYN